MLYNVSRKGGTHVLTSKEIERSLISYAGGALVTIADVTAWTGRSRDWTRLRVLRDLDCITEGRTKFYFAGDVAKALIALSQK